MMHCRHCHAALEHQVLDLGIMPVSNAYLTENDLQNPEPKYPLRLWVCHACWLVQTEDFVAAHHLFTPQYAYFSSFSETWLRHCERYVEQVIARLGLDQQSQVIEVAANDGYLLQYFQRHGIPSLGIEPTASTARIAREKGIAIVEAFFDQALAETLEKEHGPADLMIANNVLAHVPEINSFVAGFTRLLKPTGVVTFEFPHLLNFLANSQFDTVYHEHYSYLSLIAVQRILAAQGLTVFDVNQLPTHGGSLRVWASREDGQSRDPSETVQRVLTEERQAGLDTLSAYRSFQSQANSVRDAFRTFVQQQLSLGKRFGAYGAAAKGNTLLNYCGLTAEQIPFVVDRNPAKQGHFLPGSHIPIVDEAHLTRQRPDWIVILPWNLKTEVMSQLHAARAWNASFVTAVPQLTLD